MPKIYTKEEKENIRRELQNASRECLKRYGVRHTTVDELVKMVNIPKGTFYLFYNNKEQLFLDTLETFSNNEEERYLQMLENLDENHIVTSLSTVFYEMAYSFYKSGLYNLLDDNQMNIIMRHLNDDEKERVKKSRYEYINKILYYFSIDDDKEIASFKTAFNALFYIMLHDDAIDDIESALKTLIRGLVLQLVE